MKGLLLDTHVWFQVVSQDSIFTAEVIKKINLAAQKGELFIASITLWEIAMLEAKGRIKLAMNNLHWINQAIKLTMVQVLDISSDIAIDSCNLPGNFHPDPADRIIVSTARTHNLLLVTADKAILKYSSEKYLKTLAV